MPEVALINTPLTIDLSESAIDQGWTISGDKACHSGCFAGIAIAPFTATAGKDFVLEYRVDRIDAGAAVYAMVANLDGTTQTAAGLHTQTFTIPADATDLSVYFYGDGVVCLTLVRAYSMLEEPENGVTLGFNELNNKWVTYYSFLPENMLKYMDEFFTFKNGKLYKHNVSNLANHFYGVQYTSKITFIANADPKINKLWYNLRLDSKGGWFAPRLSTLADDQFPNGMTSRLKKKNFKSTDAKLWADILRDINDPKFSAVLDDDARQVQALFEGRKMQGCLLVIELECADTVPVKLVSAEVYYTEIQRTL